LSPCEESLPFAVPARHDELRTAQLWLQCRLRFVPSVRECCRRFCLVLVADSDDEEGGCPTLADLEAGLKCMATPAKASTYTYVSANRAIVDPLGSQCAPRSCLLHNGCISEALYHRAGLRDLTPMCPLCAAGTPCSRACGMIACWGRGTASVSLSALQSNPRGSRLLAAP
jgi:hypothetical protein